VSEELKIIFKYLLDFAKHPEEYNDDMVALLKVEQVELLLAYVDNLIGQLRQEQNITNELEKWLEEDLKQVYRDAGHRHNLILEVLDKLQELKGSNSNE